MKTLLKGILGNELLLEADTLVVPVLADEICLGRQDAETEQSRGDVTS